MEYLTYQISDEACSLSCFQMLLVNRSGKREYKRARLEGKMPYSLLDLEKGARRYGYKLSFFDAGKEGIGYPFNEKQPFLAVLGEKEKGHMVYVRKINKRFVYIFDPEKGKRRYEKKEFNDLFSGIFGIMENNRIEEGEKVCSPFLSPFFPLGVTLLNILGEISLLVGFFFFYKDGNILLPMLSFIAFGLPSLSSRMLLLRINKKLDDKYLSRTYSEEKGMMGSSYKRYHFCKRYLLASLPNAISSSIGAIAMVVLLSLNNPFFLLPVTFSLVSVILSSYLFKTRLERKRDSLERLELSLQEKQEKEETLAALKEIGDISSSFARDIEYERIVSAVGLLSSNLLSMLGEKEVTLNFYLFHLFALLGIYMLLKKAVEPFCERKEFLIARAHYAQFLSEEEA